MRRRLVTAAAVAAVVGPAALPGGAWADGPPAVLGLGSRGPAVTLAQRLLGQRPTGVYGRRMARAVRRFQAVHGLRADGQLGPRTWVAIEHELDGRPGERVLRLGARGTRVSTLQWTLGLPATARFGPGTRQAVRAYQASHGLVADGQVGPATAETLGLDSPPPARPAGDPGALPPGAGERPAVTPDGPASPAARRAAEIALGELGVPYMWGGETPAGFDCSGLVQYAYGRAGIALPRVAADQFTAGPHVALADLRAGDLVFFEHLGHVGIYLGGGRFVHAPHTGTVVQIARLTGWYLRNYAGATRVA